MQPQQHLSFEISSARQDLNVHSRLQKMLHTSQALSEALGVMSVADGVPCDHTDISITVLLCSFLLVHLIESLACTPFLCSLCSESKENIGPKAEHKHQFATI